MSEQRIPTCGKNRTPMEWKQTTFEYNEDGISVRVPGVYGWVCPETGEVAFTPETAKELVAVVRQFIASAKQAKQMRTLPSEYIVSVA
jgi:YgiT-type zinc finger domain-containing protein